MFNTRSPLPVKLIAAQFGLTFVLSILGTSAGHSIDLLKTQGVTQTGDDSYTIVRLDPHFIVPIEDRANLSGEQQFLRLPVQVTRKQEHKLPIKLVIFFASIGENADYKFDPLHRIIFTLPDEPVDDIVLPVPLDLTFTKPFLRLDIDNCDSCDVTFSDNIGYLIETPSATDKNYFLVEDYRLINGSNPLPKDGLTLNVAEWQPNSIELSGNQATVVAADPFLISDILDIDTEDLGGLIVKLMAPKATSDVYNFQLFYGTEKHKFTERASSLVRIAAGKNSPDKAIEFLIPLNFLSTQLPPDKLITHLRLDLPEKHFEQNETWSFQSLTLIDKQQLTEHQDLVPSQLVHFKFQRASKRQVLKGIFNKITSDLGFTIFYLLLLICFPIICIWQYRK